MDSEKVLSKKIEQARAKLNQAVLKYGLQGEESQRISVMVDRLIEQYNQQFNPILQKRCRPAETKENY